VHALFRQRRRQVLHRQHQPLVLMAAGRTHEYIAPAARVTGVAPPVGAWVPLLCTMP
jgi:hypothetical protein